MTEKQNTPIFGIDLGTTYSCIAYVDEYGKATVVPNAEGDLVTPSVVLFEPINRVVGKEAKNGAVSTPDCVVSFVKRHMGEETWRFHYDGTDYSPEEISSYILRKVVTDAETQLDHKITDVVITCPAYFGIAEREATATAGKLAGLTVRSIINEPTATALDYGLQSERDQVVLVYDLGGGTFDITMIEIKRGEINVIATGGDHQLGGKDWDEDIVRYLAAEWQRESGIAEDPLDTPETFEDLRLKAESAKRTLTARPETKVNVIAAGKPVTVTLTREKFDVLTQHLLSRTIELTREMLDIARGKGYETFDQILLVGGSTRMPQVKERVTRELGIEPKVHDPDQSVAKGAAIYGQKLGLDDQISSYTAENPAKPMEQVVRDIAAQQGMRPEAIGRLISIVPRNVTSHSFGVIALDRDRKEVIANIVQANETIPAQQTRTFGTDEHNQEAVLIRIFENNEMTDTAEPERGREIGEAWLKNLPPRLPAGSPIEVTFELDEQQRLHMTARDLTGGGTVETDIELKASLSQEELEAARERSTRLTFV